VAEHQPDGQRPSFGAAFLLAQLGAHATARYAERVATLDLSPAHTGALRRIAVEPGQSQQALAGQLGVVPSKIVSLVDDLESRDLLERRRNPADRRNYQLHLTEQGGKALAQIREIAQAHERDITSGLTAEEHQELIALLNKVAQQQGLTQGVHPGYRNLR
jgi:DNA-binding MarR family transcriptional regulator